MTQKYYLIALIMIVIIAGLAIPYGGSFETNNKEIFQVSTFPSLYNGNLEGNITIGELKKHGDNGIGTLNGLDGEMMELNGIAYQAKPDGHVYVVDDSAKTPFAMVTFFNADEILVINKTMSSTELEQYLNSTLPSKNMFYSFKIIGTFDNVTARSVPKQNKPYPKLTGVYEHQQTVFNFTNINGTMVGFWCPEYASGVNLNDYHFHFLSDNKQDGGHVLDFKVKKVIVAIDYIPDMYILLPNGGSLKMIYSAS